MREWRLCRMLEDLWKWLGCDKERLWILSCHCLATRMGSVEHSLLESARAVGRAGGGSRSCRDVLCIAGGHLDGCCTACAHTSL